jgi:DNA-binding CsgD family transcriptional regulator
LLSLRAKLSAPGAADLSADSIVDAFPSLTPREAEILRLFALGLTAPEIGSKLFISERTVEAHLAHAYSKLGLRSRRQLRERFAEVFR